MTQGLHQLKEVMQLRVPTKTKHTSRKENGLAKVDPLSQWQLMPVIDSTARNATRHNSTSQQKLKIFHYSFEGAELITKLHASCTVSMSHFQLHVLPL